MANLPSPTARLRLRQANLSDSAFMLQLLTEPSWERFIRATGVRTEEEARAHLEEKFIPAYADGLGFWLVESIETGQPMGVCGLAQRPYLEHIDLGFAFLEEYWGRGYAEEAAFSAIDYARDVLGKNILWAITVSDNAASIRLLQRLGFNYLEDVTKPEGDKVSVFELKLN